MPSWQTWKGAPYECNHPVYVSDGVAKVEVAYEGNSFWLKQRELADLLGVDVRTVSERTVNIFESGELDREATIRKFRKVRIEGGREVASADGAKKLAGEQYEQFRMKPGKTFMSDFKREVKRIKGDQR
jgi:hypothetical protein